MERMGDARSPAAGRLTVVRRDRDEPTPFRLPIPHERVRVLTPAVVERAMSDEALVGAHPDLRVRAEVEAELVKWRDVTARARARLDDRRERAPRLGATEIAEATRLRNEWRYAEQVHARQRRRRTRREADELRTRFESYLARFGAPTIEDLAVVGSGFGSTDADVAIREAATVVALAEERCGELRDELARADAARDAAARLHALCTAGDPEVVVVVDDALGGLEPWVRRCAFATLADVASTRRVVVVVEDLTEPEPVT